MHFRLKRREFITLLGGVAARGARAAASGKSQGRVAAFGCIYGREYARCGNPRGREWSRQPRDLSLEIIVRLADGDVSRLPALATDLSTIDSTPSLQPPLPLFRRQSALRRPFQ